MSDTNGHGEWFELVVMVKTTVAKADELLSKLGDACDLEGVRWQGSMEAVNDPEVYAYRRDLEFGQYPKGTVLHVLTDSVKTPYSRLPVYVRDKRPPVVCGGSGGSADETPNAVTKPHLPLCKGCEAVLAEVDSQLAVWEEHALLGRTLARREACR